MVENEKTPIEKAPEGETAKAKPAPFAWTWKSFFFSFLWLAVLLWAIDLGTKWTMVNACAQTGTNSFAVIPGFFYLTLTFNTGSSFGLGQNDSWARYVFIVISWVASGAILFYWIKSLPKKDAWIDAVFALCFTGAFGNGIDRTFYWPATTGFSGVVDFFQFYIFGYGHESFAIFNVADACLCVGIALLIVVELFRAIKTSKKGEAK